jgi:hypothetical protein
VYSRSNARVPGREPTSEVPRIDHPAIANANTRENTGANPVAHSDRMGTNQCCGLTNG